MAIVKQIGRAFVRICAPTSNTTTATTTATPPSSDDGHEHHEQHRQNADKTVISTASPSTPKQRQPNELCEECSKLDVRAMLEQEKIEVPMGPLSLHLTPDCPFCNLISEVVHMNWGEGWTSSRLCNESDPIPNLYVQSRSPMSIMRHGRLDYPEPRLLMAMDVTPPGYSENRRVIREVDRVKDRFIIAEIEAVPGAYDETEGKNPQLVPRRQVGEIIDYELVKSWLHRCRDHTHTAEAQKLMNFELFNCREGFRLIDVEEERLVLVKQRCAFAALSYVWGQLPTVLYPGDPADGQQPILLTTMDNLDRLSAPQGLSASSIAEMKGPKLPQTVQDTMAFCRNVGLRHLWIDTLCIVQDDKTDKDYMIQSMDDVYGHAAVTLIAAAGADADSGLRGVSHRTGRPINPFTIIDDGITEHLSLCPPSLGEQVRASVWNTRGWTFQEQALSQRCLYFTPEELYFNCIELQWREAYDLEDVDPELELRVRTGPPWWNRKLRKDLDPTPYHYLGELTRTLTLKDYQAAVQDYSRKRLSFADDVLVAFEGVFNRFTKTAAFGKLSLHQTQGIPVNHLHQALLWFPSEEAQKRKPTKPDVSFSTWTWASWDGPIEFVFADSMWLSRNISQVPMKKIPIHVLILCWYYGGTTQRFWSQDMWQVICEKKEIKQGRRQMKTSEAVDAFNDMKTYTGGKIGINVDELLAKVTNDVVHNLATGELGFIGAYLDAGDVSLVEKHGPRVHNFAIGSGNHKGEFRFDDEAGEVDEFVAVVTSDTITRDPVTQSIFLGLQTVDGVSRRVGLGWVYYSKEDAVPRPPWKYKFFRLN